MGKAARLHREAVQNGTEQPFRQPVVTNAQIFRCQKCGDPVGETMARDHIRKCWKYPINDTDPIPAVIPEEVKNG